jgi:DNA-binding CsgD family transcriptional regulator
MRYEAVALFADRATAVHPGFVIDSSNIAAVATVCHSLDGIPLALELAASRLRSLSVNELVVRLDDRYNLLTGGSRAALPRQRTLRSLVDWSFELCSETERLVWARLSAFAGGFDLSAAEAVCSDETVPSDLVWEIVSQLVEKSILVVSDERNAARYLFTETLREYGRERLREAVDGGAAVRARHRDWARQLVRSAEAQWFGADQAAIFKRLRREHANLREALNSCLADPVEAKVGLEMAGGLRFYWLVSGRVNEGRRWLDQLLRVCDDQGPSRVQALCVAGYLATMVSDFARAEDLLDQADRLTTRLGDRFGTALGIQIRALTALFRGDPGRAAPLFEKALASHRDLGDESAAIYDEVELALCVTLLGASESATEILEECLVATEARGEQWLRALTLWALGIERCKRRDYDHAEAAELESLRYRSMLDDRSTMWMNIQVLSWIAAARGDAHRAGRLLGASEALAKSVGLSTKLLRHLRDLEEDHEHLVRGNVSKLQYDQGYDEGRRLAFDEVIELALGDERPTPEPQTGSPALASLDSLTKRESQVADLVSQGMSNKEIATALVISPRTAEAHVENILRKLGLTSRTQMAAWKLHRGDN